MAGESPDRSKQRESSAEPTSGSAGPVPESRNERDPRLAVSRGGVDTATQVLSVRDLRQEPAEPEDSAEDTGSEDSEKTPENPARKPDTRLRDAVAAWVATADEEPAEGAGAEDADAEGTADTDADAGGAEGSKALAPEADNHPDGSTTNTHEGDDTAPDADAEAKAGTGEAASAEGERRTDTDETAAAASVTDSAGAGAADGGPEAAERTQEADTGAREGTAGADDAAEARAASGDAEASGTKSADVSSAGASADTASDAEDAADVKASAGRAGLDDSKPATGQAAPDADRATAPKPGNDSKPASGRSAGASDHGEGSPAEAGASGGAAPGAPEDAEGAAKGSDGPADRPRVVDQPTAVFRAPRPAKPAVDQPTTMLKLGDAAKPEAKADSAKTGSPTDKPPADKPGTGSPADKADAPSPADKPAAKSDAKPADRPPAGPAPAPKPKPEAAAERTSKFVALKPLDDPSTRKPPADATTALRKVAPPDATSPVPQVGPERTAQQPLPPKPPLDLLAELTNTPPPPETPVRTIVRRVKIWTPLVLLLAIVFAVVQTLRPLPSPTLDLSAEDSYTFDGAKADIPWPSAGQAALDVQGIGSFGSSGTQKAVPIASVAKVMTAYIILRDHPLKSGAAGPKIKIDQTAEDQSKAGQESTVTVTAGDSISQREALESILIASANNVARLLARWDAGSEKAFVTKMNATAKDLGMANSTYTDPSGLNNTTVSTAVDQVKLAKAAMKEPAFREVAAMMSYTDYKGVNHSNWNHLVGSNNVVGIKTGTTTSALGNLVFAAKKEIDGETRTIVGAVIRQPAGGPDNTILGAALDAGDKLIRAAQGALKAATILKKGDVVGYVDDGLGGRTPVVITKDVTAVGWAGLKVRLSFVSDELPHTAKAGAKVGTLTVGDGGTSGAVQVPVALQKDLAEPGFTDKLTRLG